MTNITNLSQQAFTPTFSALNNLSAISVVECCDMGINLTYSMTGQLTLTTNSAASTASFDMTVPANATGGQVLHPSGTICGISGTYLIIGNLTYSGSQTKISVSIKSNNVWGNGNTITLGFSIQYTIF